MSQHLFSLPERNNIDDSFFSDFRAKYYKSNIPIVIDNGSHYCRVGWADEDLARLQFRPQVAKVKGKRENEPPSILVGNDIREADIHKLNPRSPFDQNVVYHFDTMEHILDHSFQRLGIDTQSISNPILMSETLCNPSYCRSAMNELLFECYGAPGVCYGVDSLFSFYANRIPSTPTIDPFTNSLADLTRVSAPSPPPFSATTGIVISSSNSATHVYPVINNQWIPSKCKRLGVGGITATEYLRKLIHLKYPLHRNIITAVRAQYLKEDHSYIALDYAEELDKYRDPKPKDIHTIQLPFVPQVAAPKVDQERKLQVRKEQGQRLKDINDKKRQEKRAEQEERLACLLEIKGMQSSDTDEFVSALEGEGLNGEEELNATITDLEESLGKPLSIPQLPDDQMYPLLDVSDDQLNDEELKEKKKQKMLKSMRDGRVAAKKKRDDIQDKEKQLEKLEEDKYNQNPQQYLANLQERKQDILNRREQRQKQAAAGTGRRSRGRTNIKMLAMRDADDSKKSGKRKLEDTFGANEEDWDVYLDNQEVVKEEEDQLLNQIEALLAKYDPDYVTPGDLESGNGNGDEESLYQIHLGVERIRITETVFQPQAILGMEQMGLIEIIQSILATFDEQTQQDLVQNIFFTGGNTTYDNFEKRLTNELTMLRPFQSKFQVRPANDPMNDAWLGMAKWFQNSPEEFKKSVVTKAEYEERGASYFKPYFASNVPY